MCFTNEQGERAADLQDRHYERASSDAVSRKCSASVIE